MTTISKKYNTPAAEEIIGIFTQWPIWFTLAWNEIKLKYRRSSLGPFWITASTAIRIYVMGFLYAHLFKVDTNTYFPYLASGIITWITISTIALEMPFSFIFSESYLRNIKILYSHLTMKIVIQNIIVFAHNLLAYIPIIIGFAIYEQTFNPLNLFLLFPNLILLITIGYLWGTIIAILSTRFRDFYAIVESSIQIVFFMTPIMWMPSLLPEKYQWAAFLNPFYHILALVREPLLGHPVSLISYSVNLAVIIIGIASFSYLMNKAKHRIIFWL